ncbi:MAG: hypothetical protein ACPG6V_13880, partial [Flavobacteriales bacterium]
TLRNPELIDEDRKEQGFVYYPQLSSSAFYNASLKVNPYDEIKKECEAFNYIRNKKLLVRDFDKLNRFSTWLRKNKSVLTFSLITNKINNIGGLNSMLLSSANQIIVWDNLVFQTVTNKSKIVRELLIELLVSNQFLKKFKDVGSEAVFIERLQEFKRRSNANVVIPTDFLPTVNKMVIPNIKLSSVLTNRLEKELESAMAKRRTYQYRKQIKTVKLEAQTEFSEVRMAKKEHIASVKAFRMNPANQTTDPDTGKVTVSPTPDSITYTAPTVTRTATENVNTRIVRSTSSLVRRG